ncbi:type III-B CRISPR-associated protein Cas10/Cmr2 [Nostoc sp. FACHB-888]|uniref:type III-B CRISPR-associated protein Cas10/Cmr2 n=1 Tax=Nostoc sp. FACHB-888 TaxID=2692842 RepID=UPI00168823B6|nr:type III-B CRISPR-associated protein Cas10/Cmr2 [Nostoc sp. FACHB-888]MBD2247395.1 type III-B CRISPR-associated protein Cas10/Cmr2 [Nostoc sp. FACHB-888]
MNVDHRKLYALLQEPTSVTQASEIIEQLQCLHSHEDNLRLWWGCIGKQAADISGSSDQVNLQPKDQSGDSAFQLRHPISAECKTVTAHDRSTNIKVELSQIIRETDDIKKVFWWFWRFYPEILASKKPEALLIPAHRILPDSPLHSYKSTVSALVGAMFPSDQYLEKPEHPYLLLFTFSPVQEFIKSSRKFLDFWAGSYLLHYLSAKLCWYVAETYGPDAVITPSLWSQEIIDALIVKKYPDMKAEFEHTSSRVDPVSRFNNSRSTSLSTAGFPNVITVLVPGKKAAEALGKELSAQLTKEWQAIAQKVCSDIKTRTIKWLDENIDSDLVKEFLIENENANQRNLQKWQQHSCWEWNQLWNAQINNTWENYWTAVPFGNPEQELITSKGENNNFNTDWIEAAEAIAPSHPEHQTPTEAEKQVYQSLNVGTWWGNVQSRLGKLIQSVKNTRTWNLPASPGERSSLSGQFSAIHPNLLYNEQFREGGGLSSGSMRLFWQLMSLVYPGLFNGSEKLNAIELTKRMAWQYGGVAESLGIKETFIKEQINYENLIRFPNLSSIAAARFAYNHPTKVQGYWNNLNSLIQKNLPKQHQKFCSRTRGRPFYIYKTDRKINPENRDGKDYNGVMFSSKWLAEDMGLQDNKKIETLRSLVEEAHKQSCFGDGSPSDWWVIVLADGDNMGKYVSGAKLEKYDKYIVKEVVDKNNLDDEKWLKLLDTKKRMGPATHVGLNRALLDFSNRLVPYLTEKRFCGKVIYSGGDDVMAVLPLEDLPEYLLSLRAAWSSGKDPFNEFESEGGYWTPKSNLEGIPNRSHFTMGARATMSMGIVIAHKSVPLPTVLENIWSAEKEQAKKLPNKDGLCFRVIYGGGNTLEAVMKGKLLESWYELVKSPSSELSPLLLRLAEELPRRATVTENYKLFSKAAKVIMSRRDESKKLESFSHIETWLNDWEDWVKSLKPQNDDWDKWIKKLEDGNQTGTQPEDLGNILRFSAFWVDKMVQRQKWGNPDIQEDN